jgi:hypothetical protein
MIGPYRIFLSCKFNDLVYRQGGVCIVVYSSVGDCKMMKTKHLIYAQDKQIGGKNFSERVSSVRRQLEKFDSKPLEEKIYVEARKTLESRKTILQLLDRYDHQPHLDPIIAVPTWKDIVHPEVARRLYAGSYSVLIAELAEGFDQQIIIDGRDYVGSGPVMSHVGENNAKLKSYLDGLNIAATHGENKMNNDRRNNAEIYAAMMWDHIERIAKETNTTVQTAIAKRLDEEGHKSAEGAVISQSHVRRYIHGSGKHKKWEAIKQAMKDPELFDDQKKKP